jgi:hypothetical protein
MKFFVAGPAEEMQRMLDHIPFSISFLFFDDPLTLYVSPCFLPLLKTSDFTPPAFSWLTAHGQR